MRLAHLALVSLVSIATLGCSSNGMPMNNGGSGGGGSAGSGGSGASGGSGGSGNPDMALPPGTTEMQLISSSFTISSGQEIVYQCQRLTVQQDTWIVRVTPVSPVGVHHEVLAIDPSKAAPDGLQSHCDFGANWQPLFASGINSPSLDMPPNVALKVPAGSQIVLQLHLLNATPNPINDTAAIKVAMVPDGTGYTQASVPFAGSINFTISGATNPPYTVNGTCTLSNDAQFFATFPHMHQYGRHITISTEGSVNTTVWDKDYNFMEQAFGEWAPIQLKQGDKINVTCTYDPSGAGVKFGQSSTQEMCFAISYLTPPISGTLGPNTAFCVF